ncbi:HTH-type transcriptional activator RhaR [Salmonella enterica subsp. arizonae]|uniref:HTH-type transcriptional activator RhaR n=1 Tax=Salmonella enterica subsp. arizonae TaxID=59203 RepID=A0A379S9V0_SALER|nr:HTH-type transcriptional activator RhaR [Salmonella enterica subsp. arizonae]
MNQARQVINQLEHENNGRDPLANEIAELLFGQLVMTLKRASLRDRRSSGDLQRNPVG